MARYVHYRVSNALHWGEVEDDVVWPVVGDPITGSARRDGEPPLPLASLNLAPPASPSKIVCVGRNYRAHAEELGNVVPERPLIFLKPPSSLVGHGDEIVYPRGVTELVHHEGELAVVMGRRCKSVRAEEAASYIAGYTLLNDVTARDLQRLDVQFTRGKGFDTFAPMGPWLDTDFVPRAQRLTVDVNGTRRQDGRLEQMIFSVPELLAFISAVMTLEPGDVISTGTPAGVGPLVSGDRVTVTLEGLGTLTNGVI
jgi:2-keto-4-pentenoate hydratase/2-oxohepta-3-ene-1,7-dioic acid hydratase in catechol pathway